MGKYLRPQVAKVWETDTEIKKSHFLCFIQQVSSESEARSFIDNIRKLHPRARHHCTAYVLHQEDARPILRSNDDGEPAGTAGHPMLDALHGSGMMDICAVVVRYFGGVKLGTGGLVRAYSHSVSCTIEHVQTVCRQEVQHCFIAAQFVYAPKIEAWLRSHGKQQGVYVHDVLYGVNTIEQCDVLIDCIVVKDEHYPQTVMYIEDQSAQISQGRAHVHSGETEWVDVENA